MLPDSLVKLCGSLETVTTQLASASPSTSVQQVVAQLYPSERGLHKFLRKLSVKNTNSIKTEHVQPTREELDQVVKLGAFGAERPSDLFLKVCYLRVQKRV